ncbi:MAG: toll/interleukin-1 receptor domain-containing protein, partial [Alphaproteobacteria bacterium]|nr:toll/interleukin-1 receptor domain-containing protein [Alphaproteobacteria bacterium]
ASKLFVFFSSENSNKSEWTKGEIFLAQKYKKQILPVRIDDSEYEKSVMIVLLPLQYIVCKNGVYDESLEELHGAISKFIGEPAKKEVLNEKSEKTKRRWVKQSLWFSGIMSLLLAFFMMVVSGEYMYNVSLSLFSMTITALLCFVACLYVVLLDKNWNERPMTMNVIYLLGMTFFLSYSIMAFGLCYVSFEVFSLNYPSIICAVISIYGLIKLMSYKRIGYIILWICVCLFSFGSYWWLMHSIIAPIAIAVVGSICMLVLTGLLKMKHKGTSMWSKLS